MRIFISHSSKQKLFVKELRKYLPHHLNLWIDEKEILIGSDLDHTIKNGIDSVCDYFIVVIDHFSINSAWVRKEIEWAIEKEEKLGRVFLLPILLESEVWNLLDIPGVKNRKYLSCFDFTDACIETLAKGLSSEILGWLCNEFESRKKSYDNKKLNENKNLEILREANELLNLLSNEIKKVILPHRKVNPLSPQALFVKIRENSVFEGFNNIQLNDLLIKLQNQGGIKGIYYDGEKVFLQRETYTYKFDLYKELKRKIAEKAFEYIEPEQVIAIDGGSTALEVSLLIAKSIRLNDLYGLTVITNSLTTANTLLEALSDLNVRDFDNVCNVYLLGGRARPISFTIVPEIKSKTISTVTTLESYLVEFGGADISFLGTNGVKEGEGFAVHNPHELRAKEDMVNNSKRKIMLADPSKFSVKQERVFARFTDELIIITSDDGTHASEIEVFKQNIKDTNSTLIIA